MKNKRRSIKYNRNEDTETPNCFQGEKVSVMVVNTFVQYVLWSLTYPDTTYPDYSLVRTHVWKSIPIPQQKVTHLSRNSVIRTVSLGTEVFG